jgi:hypothetical protein
MGGRGLIYVSEYEQWQALVNAKPSGFIKYVQFFLLRINLLVKVAKTGWSLLDCVAFGILSEKLM